MDHFLNNVKNYINENDKKIVHELINFVKVPNDVFDTNQIYENALFLKKMMESRGIEVEIWSSPSGSPLVYGEFISNPDAKTILIYSHFDGVPVETAEWHSDPYEPVFRERLPFGKGDDWNFLNYEDIDKFEGCYRLFGRSVADSKNAIVAILTALDYMKVKDNKPAVNLKFLFDGEEEIESPNLHRLMEIHRERISCDLVISASGETHQSGLPTVELGFRGMLQLDLQVYTMSTDLHSGHFGNFAPNAIQRFIHLLSSMKNDSGEVMIKHFYDDVIPLSKSELDAISKIPKIEGKILEQFSIYEPEMKNKSLQELINLPTFNIRGITGGFVGTSARNIIPSVATAEIDIRLVHGMDPDKILHLMIHHIEEQNWTVMFREPSAEELRKHPRIVQIVKKGSFVATKTPMDTSQAAFVIDSVKRAIGEELVVMPTEGGSLPLYVFQQIGLPVIGIPTSNFDCNQHTHDENLELNYFYRAIEIFASIFLNDF
ncbi:M20/M25/M40 family metallo-hydrolase [Bacillus sp. CGMCC 1.16607]|uniref:M20/M25/M40 family metallo-hydrolase n=1 Tax=Bacillus sp. CGMCC 1.16607 TaxID=3351842 RepID=UPI0036306F2E